MTQTAERTDYWNYETADAHEVMPIEEVAATIAWYEQQLKTVSTDERSLLLEEQARFIEGLLGDDSAELLRRSIHFLAGQYEGRSITHSHDDGSRTLAWGTRDQSKQFLNFTYFVHQDADGEVRYRVDMRNGGERTQLSFDEDSEVHVVQLSRPRPGFSGAQISRLREHDTLNAMKTFVGASMAAYAMVGERIEYDAVRGLDDANGERAKADRMAIGLLDDSELVRGVTGAPSAQEVDRAFDASLRQSQAAVNGPHDRENRRRIMAMAQA